jgi:predicted dehydrogenase
LSSCRVGILGCGKMGQRHIRAHLELGNVPLVYDALRPDTAEICQQLGVVCVPGLDDLLSCSVAVDVCTPTATHVDIAAQALDAGVSVLCEKPLCVSLEEALRLQSFLAGTPALPILAVGYIYRYSPAVRFLRQCLDGERIGQPFYSLLRVAGPGSHAAWKHQGLGGGIHNEKMTHLLDLADWLYGPISDVEYRHSAVLKSTRVIGGQEVAATEPDLMILALTAGHTHVVCMADFVSAAYRFEIDVQGTAGSLALRGSASDWTVTLGESAGMTAPERQLTFGLTSWLKPEISEYMRCVTTGEALEYHGVEDTIRMLKATAEAI